MPDATLADRVDAIARGRLLVRQTEACAALGIGRQTLLDEIEAGRLRYVLVGTRRRFKPADLVAYIERQGRGCDGTEASPPPGQGRRIENKRTVCDRT